MSDLLNQKLKQALKRPAQESPTPPPPKTRLTVAGKARLSGHCGTCKRFLEAPDWGANMGECSLGWAYHEPLRAASQVPVILSAGAECMTVNPNKLNPDTYEYERLSKWVKKG